MALNRIIDRYIDAENSRTKNRAIPQGLIKLVEAWIYTILAAVTFFLSAYRLSPLAFRLSPVIVLAFVFYSYSKRFTWLSHFLLGATIGLAPLGAWIAITNSVSSGAVVLSIGVGLWVTGFDIIYACDDYDYDRSAGLFSIPARFGIAKALSISAITHIFSTVFFIITGLILHLGIIYWIGICVAVFLMYKQHKIISLTNLAKINIAFFNLNGILNIVMFLTTLADIEARM
jgi:4-hydroxybenzoate polyprenyltransferase